MKRWVAMALWIVVSLALATPLAAEGKASCTLNFDLTSKAVFYKKGKGSGTISCDNGQSASVNIATHGGGLTFGKEKIVNGTGVFSKVGDIGELFGAYAQAEASAGAQKSVAAQAMWKGDVSLALSGAGEGINVGFSFGKFKITRM